MAKLIAKNLLVKVNGVNLTDHIASVDLSKSVDEIEVTSFGSSARSRIGGLEDASLTLSFHQDFASNSTFDTLESAFGSSGTVTILMGTSSSQGSATSTTPLLTIPVLCSQSSVGGQIGDLMTVDVTWPANGSITKSTTGTF